MVVATDPIVSVVVSLRNAEPYIKKCVDSILEQTLRHFEIILVDDASRDGGFELCQKLYGDNPNIKILRHEKFSGTAVARNTGMKFASGKYICFVNGEDFILPYALNKFSTAAEKFNAEIVHVSSWFEFNQDAVEPVSNENLWLRCDDYSRDGLLKNNFLYRMDNHWRNSATNSNAWQCFCRKDFLERWGINFLDIAAADEPFNFALFCLAERYYVLNSPFYVKRKLNDSPEDAAQKFFDGLRSMIVGSAYIEKFLAQVPRFQNYDLWRENILSTFFQRVAANYTAPHYENLLTNASMNALADKTLTPFFPQAKSFVKYFFNAAHILNRQAETLTRINNNLSEQTLAIFSRMEISRKKIVFVNCEGKGYGCNPKYIAEEILRQKLPFDLVWLVNDANASMPDKIRKVRYGTLDSMFELATAKIVVTNTNKILPFPNKKDGQFFIMTWHSGTDFLRGEQNVSCATIDLMMANTQEQFDDFKQMFDFDGEILKCGLPRNDIFFRRDDKLAARVKKKLNVPRFSKIVLYTPIYDANASLDAKKLLDVLKEKFGGKWTLVTRCKLDGANIIDATDYPDEQKLILIADAIVSDYSPAIFDGICAGKKIFLYAEDIDDRTNDGSLKPLYFELPYKINRSSDELFDAVKNFNTTEQQVKRFVAKVKPFNTGNAAADVVAIIQTVIDNT